MHEENKRSIRHSYWASRVPKSQLNVAIEHVGKIPIICGGGGGITAASSDSSGNKDDENYDFFRDGDDIGNDIVGGFGQIYNKIRTEYGRMNYLFRFISYKEQNVGNNMEKNVGNVGMSSITTRDTSLKHHAKPNLQVTGLRVLALPPPVRSRHKWRN